jgi:hypothetical protein
MTKGEYDACDYLIAYFLDQNDFFIVPRSELISFSDGQKWRFVVTTDTSGKPHARFDGFRNAWHTLHPDFTDQTLELDDDFDDEDSAPVELDQAANKDEIQTYLNRH